MAGADGGNRGIEQVAQQGARIGESGRALGRLQGRVGIGGEHDGIRKCCVPGRERRE